MRSSNKYDAWVWVKKVVNSCNTPKQYLSAIRLVANFKRQFLCQKDDELWMDATMLEMTLFTKA